MIERQYQSKGFRKYPGIKCTPGQISQNKLVTMIVRGFTVDQIRKRLPMLSGIAIATTWVFIQRRRSKRGLLTPELKTYAQLMADKNNAAKLPPSRIQAIARAAMGKPVSEINSRSKAALKPYYDMSTNVFKAVLK